MIDRNDLLAAVTFCRAAIDEQKYAGLLFDWTDPGVLCVVGTDRRAIHIARVPWQGEAPALPFLYLDPNKVQLFLSTAAEGVVMTTVDTTNGDFVLFDLEGKPCPVPSMEPEGAAIYQWRDSDRKCCEPKGWPTFAIGPVISSRTFEAFKRIQPRKHKIELTLYGQELGIFRLKSDMFEALMSVVPCQ